MHTRKLRAQGGTLTAGIQGTFHLMRITAYSQGWSAGVIFRSQTVSTLYGPSRIWNSPSEDVIDGLTAFKLGQDSEAFGIAGLYEVPTAPPTGQYCGFTVIKIPDTTSARNLGKPLYYI